MKSLFKKACFFIFMFFIVSYCEVTYRGHPILNDPWEADSLFVGAGFIVNDSTVDIKVIWKVTDTYRLGELHFMVPGSPDSSIFLFHNIRDSFPEEPDTVNLGKFPSGTQLVFMYKVVDAAGKWPEFENKRLFSGQNRESIDDYISEMTMDTVLPGAYSRRWLAAGKIDDTRVEGGFEDGYNASFRSIIFEVSNVDIIK